MDREHELTDLDVVELGVASEETKGLEQGQGEGIAKRVIGISND
ncbi:benenodin family lasso peptide [Novosphingobium sp. G106]|nr:benenodin family lasso peptide [Novosphingobium sp. G106]MBV1687720.1 benenodin family lasso peptide [Novosphingobium sp. G106]